MVDFFDVGLEGITVDKSEHLIKDAFYFGVEEGTSLVNQLQVPYYVENARVSMYITAARVLKTVPIIDEETGEVIGEEVETIVFEVGKYVEIQRGQHVIVNNGLDVYTVEFMYDDVGTMWFINDDSKDYKLYLYTEKISYTDAFKQDPGYLSPDNPDNIIDEITELPPDEIIAEQEPNLAVATPRYVDVPIADIANYDATQDDCEFVQAAEIGISSNPARPEDRPGTIGVERFNNLVVFMNRNFINLTGVLRLSNLTAGQTLNLFKVNLENGFLKDETIPGFRRTDPINSTQNNAQLQFFGDLLQLRVINDVVSESVTFNILIPRTKNYTVVDPATGDPIKVAP